MEKIINASVKYKEQLIGFFALIPVYGASVLIRVAFSKTDFDVASIVSGMISFIFFIIVLFGYTTKKYRLYAQGALVGWLVYFLVSVLSIFFK